MLNKQILTIALFVIALQSGTSTAMDLTQVQVVSTGTVNQTSVPVTFGQIFSPSDVSSTESLSARLLDGTNIPIQIDEKAIHADNSLRHAILSVRLPGINAGATETLIISSTSNSSAAGTAITLEDLKNSTFDFSVSLDVGGTAYSSSVQDLLTNGRVEQWLSGALVSEWLISGPVLSSGSSEHPNLSVFYHVRAYGPAPVTRVRINAIVENSWSYQPNPQNFNYSVNMKLNSASVYSNSFEHYHNARWNKYFWWGNESEVDVKHDKDYFLDSGAVSNYDRSISISESYLSTMLSSIEPMGNGLITPYMPNTGAQDGIGPLPRWTAAYILSQDLRAKNATLLNGRASGSYPLHFRDKVTYQPVSLDTHPSAGFNQGDFTPLTGSMSGHNETYTDPANTLNVDTAHHPDLAYVPYLVTGDYFFLEELQFWANYCMLRESPSNRGTEGKIISAQLRAQGWCMRTMGEAAYITPDSHALKNYFKQKVINNINNFLNVYTYGEGDSASYWNTFGVFKNVAISPPMTNSRTWMDDFVTWSMGHLVEMGFTEAIPLRNWKAQYPVGRMTRMCFIEGVSYNITVGTSSSDTFFSSWDELYEVNFGSRSKSGFGNFRDRACGSQEMADWKVASPTDSGSLNGSWTAGMMSGRAYSADSYYANAQPAMAIAKDSGITDADVAWNLFVGENSDSRFPSSGSPIKPDYSSSAQWAVVPRTTPVKNLGPAISINASPSSLASNGDNTTITWSTVNAVSCSAGGGWSGNKTVNGTEILGPLTTNTTFSLTCASNDGANNSASVTVSVPSTADTTPTTPTIPTGNSVATDTLPSNYVWGNINAGTDVYIDRSYTFVNVPQKYQGLSYLQTSNDDKSLTGSAVTTFSMINMDTVYIGYDTRNTPIPSWLGSWTETGDAITASHTTFAVYKREFPSGNVQIDGNELGNSNYIIVIDKTLASNPDSTTPDTTTPGTTTPDEPTPGTTGDSAVDEGSNSSTTKVGGGGLNLLLMILMMAGLLRRIVSQ